MVEEYIGSTSTGSGAVILVWCLGGSEPGSLVNIRVKCKYKGLIKGGKRMSGSRSRTAF
jgi:hypothetical protein